MVGDVRTGAVTTSPLQGLQRLCNSTVQRWREAGVKRSAPAGIVPTGAMMAVPHGRRAASAKYHGRRASKKNKK